MPDVMCLGILVVDVVAKPVDVYPERGRLVQAEQMGLHTGGCAGNTAIGLSRIGVTSGVMGKIGRDGFGDYYLTVMAREHVDATNVIRDESANTSCTMVLVHSDGERSFVHYVGANAAMHFEDANLDALAGVKLLHVAGSNLLPGLDGPPTARILSEAKRRGLTTALDTAWDASGRWMSLVEDALPHIDYFIPSIEEARMITGLRHPDEIAAFLLDRGVGVVGLKMGEDGCYAAGPEGSVRLPSFDVATVDATGAGDAFAAGFLAGVVKGWSLEDTARLANAVGALCVTAIGTTDGIKSLEETQRFMASARLRSA